jgi:hypothetical protein
MNPLSGVISIDSSSDATKLIAVGTFLWGVYTSTNSGISWTTNNFPSSWRTAASSADGARLTVAASNRMLSSTNYGATWSPMNPPNVSWSDIATSADGSMLAAAGYGPIYIWQEIPALSITRSSAEVFISWPASAAAARFELQQSVGLSISTWTNVPTTPNVTNSQNQVVLPVPTDTRFYRLFSRQ